MNTTNGPVVGCEIELRNGQFCGIQAIGRCAICGRAFCFTHQGYTSNSPSQRVPYIDMCAPCANAKLIEEAKRREEAEAPHHYFESGAARTDLLSSGVPPVNIYLVQQKIWEPKKGFFGRSGRYVDKVVWSGRGWILGEFKWWRPAGIHLTALVDESRDKLPSGDTRLNCGLVRVQPYTGGYQDLSSGRSDRFEGYGQSWKEVMQAVKRLTGESSQHVELPLFPVG